MSGLYSKATEILNNHDPQTSNDADSGTIMFDPKSGISQEDQQDIIRNINDIMQSSKIKASPDIFRIKAKKKGFGFPIVVNLVALGVMAVVIFILWFFFQKTETSIASGGGGVGSEAQRQIIEMQKQRAAEELNKKNQEILGIQSDLQKVNSDLTSLKENMSSEIAAKEQAIKEQFDQNLEAERKRLIAAGTAAADVERKLREMEADQNNQLQAQMVAFKRDTEVKMQERERQLLDQQRQMSAQLETATSDQKRLSAAYEAELRRSEQQLNEAEQRNRTLTAQKEKFDLIDQQIVGFYRQVQVDIGVGDFPAARTRLKNLREYLAQPAIASIPEIARRTEVENFVMESLESLMAASERQTAADQHPTAADTQTVQAEAKIVTDIRALVLQADEAYRAGNKTQADGLYLKALELIPEVNKSHQYLMGRVNEIEAFRKAQVATALDAAAIHYRNRQYGEALSSYGKALAYLPTDRNTGKLLDEIKSASLEAENARPNAQAVKAAEEKLKAGNDRFKKGAYDEAIAQYLDLLRTSSRTPAGAEAASQLAKAITAKDDAFSKQIASLQGSSTSGLDEYKKEVDVLKKTVAEREKELAALKGNLETSRNDLNQKLLDEQGRLKTAETEIERLKNLSEDYVKLQTDYGAYSRNEDGVVRTQSLEEMALGKSYLDSFLSSTTVRSAFPGLLERIKRYDRAFERAGRISALEDTLDVIKAAHALKTKADKISFLRKKADEVRKTDPTASVLLKSLVDLLSS
ncbi:MAG: hypothetical protein JXD23_01130 [Spirochaetales bacterium]|nr:hypothetical protein [Spirochaetales bacterium]